MHPFGSKLFALSLVISGVVGSVFSEQQPFAEFRKLDAYYTEPGKPFRFEVEAIAGASIKSVEIHVDDTLVGTDTTFPFSVTWTPDSLGPRHVTANVINEQMETCTLTIETETIFRPAIPLFDDMKYLSMTGDMTSFKDKLFLVAEDRFVYESRDGESWKPAFAATNPVQFTVSSTDHMVFANAENGVYFSEDGEYWHFNPITTKSKLYGVTAIGDYFIAQLDDGGQIRYAASTDLRYWSYLPPFPELDPFLVGEPWFNGRPVVIAGYAKELYFLNDEFEWQLVELPPAVDTIHELAWNQATSELYLRINEYGSFDSAQLVRSKDGLTWETVAVHPRNNFYKLIIRDGAIVLNLNPTNDGAMFSFDDGATWSMSPTGTTIYDVIKYRNGYLVSTGRGHLYYTEDGRQLIGAIGESSKFLRHGADIFTWGGHANTLPGAPVFKVTSESSYEQLTCFKRLGFVTGFCHGDPGFLAIGEHHIALSRDTINWHLHEKPEEIAGSVAFGNGIYVADLEGFAREAKGYAISRDGIHWDIQREAEPVSRVVFMPRKRKFVRSLGASPSLQISNDAMHWTSIPVDVPGLSNFFKLEFAGDFLWAVYFALTDVGYKTGIAYTDDLSSWHLKEYSGDPIVEYANGIHALYAFNAYSELLLRDGTWIKPNLPNAKVKSAANGFVAQSTTDWKHFDYNYSTDALNWTRIANPYSLDLYQFIFLDNGLYAFGESVFHMAWNYEPKLRVELKQESLLLVLRPTAGDRPSLSRSDNLRNWVPIDYTQGGSDRDTYYHSTSSNDDLNSIYYRVTEGLD